MNFVMENDNQVLLSTVGKNLSKYFKLHRLYTFSLLPLPPPHPPSLSSPPPPFKSIVSSEPYKNWCAQCLSNGIVHTNT